MYRRLLIVRHGQSIWNMDSKFTGWTNIPLTEKGEKEASNIASVLHKYQIFPNVIFTSSLDRAIKTSNIIKKQLYDYDVPTLASWRLNEKHYGNLEGVEREFIREAFGVEYTKKMRSNYTMLPPSIREIPSNMKNNYKVYKNQYYDTIADSGESKKHVYERVVPYYKNYIEPCIIKNDSPIIVTHKHTARVLMKYLKNIDDETFENYNIPSNKIISIIFDENMNLSSENFFSY